MSGLMSCHLRSALTQIFCCQFSIFKFSKLNYYEMPKKKSKTGKPQLHKDLEGFEVNINEFGEITSTMDVEKINEFLNKNVEDKKFKEREDEEEIKKGKFPKKK